MATFLKTPPAHTTTDTFSSSSPVSNHHHETTGSSSFSKSRFEAYNRLQSAAVAFGEKLPIPEIVALGGQSDGKSSLLEALLGFQFNVREVEMGTCRPLILQMVHDPTALDPRCRFQEEDSEEYGSPIVSSLAIADTIKSRTDAMLKKTKTAVSSKPIVMRAEYAHCPNLTIIDTPGFVLKAKKGEPESTPEEILSMVISLASPPHRILLFLQQSSVEWCSSLWLDAIRDIDPAFRRTLIVVSKFDNRLKVHRQFNLKQLGKQSISILILFLQEFTERWEVDRYLSASGYLGENMQPFFVALPKERTAVSNDEFRRQISQVDSDVIRHLKENVKGGYDEERYKSRIGFGCLRDYLESELHRRYKEATPSILALLEQRCSEVTAQLNILDSKILATSDVAHLRKSAMSFASSICNHMGALIDGAADPDPEQWGKTTEEEKSESGMGSWPGVISDIKPPNANIRLYGGAAFERVMHEFRCAAYSVQYPTVSREKMSNITLARAGRGGGRGIAEAAAEIARASAKSWLAPLLDTACERLAFVLINLFDLAMEKNQHLHFDYGKKPGDMDGYVGFHAALRRSYNCFIKDLAKQRKQLVRQHLDSVTSPYSQVCYETDLLYGPGPNSTFSYQTSCLDFSDQENIPPVNNNTNNNNQQTTPGKLLKAAGEASMTVPETPSPENAIDGGARKRHPRILGENKMLGNMASQNSSQQGSTYNQICSLAAQHFARIREVLVERSVTTALNSGFLTPCREDLMVALGMDLFAVKDEKFMDMFVAPGAIDILQNERESLLKRQKTLQSCLTEFKSVATSL
ncbi:putative dynamin GTPase [Helianthus annuus]|uniref:Dynamin GTPase n=1 Tax=Helianthus annuus TaxID=4232 RepID=A0A251TNC6_HELAN|nr:putative dynamin GTPase [Helianthus annuus]KAJ0884549.1 putative dynamin GTPase [Helianthus annuus]